jgi:hypothetical protein
MIRFVGYVRLNSLTGRRIFPIENWIDIYIFFVSEVRCTATLGVGVSHDYYYPMFGRAYDSYVSHPIAREMCQWSIAPPFSRPPKMAITSCPPRIIGKPGAC